MTPAFSSWPDFFAMGAMPSTSGWQSSLLCSLLQRWLGIPAGSAVDLLADIRRRQAREQRMQAAKVKTATQAVAGSKHDPIVNIAWYC